MSTFQTIPVYLTSKSGSNLSNTPLILIGYAPCVDPIAPLDANLVPSNSGSSYTESDVVENLSIRLARHSIFSLQMDWCGPSGPRTSYMTPVQSDAMIPISRNSHSDIHMFYQNFQASKLLIRHILWEAFQCCFKYNLHYWQCTDRASSCHY